MANIDIKDRNSTEKMKHLSSSNIFVIPQNSNHQESVVKYLQKQKIYTEVENNQANLHFFNQEKVSFKIDAIRDIISQSFYATYNNQEQFYVLLHFDLATIPAQNAFLKTLEEPPAKTTIILTVENQEKLLPTIISRCNLVKIQTNQVVISKTNQDLLDFVTNPQNYNYGQAIDLADTIKTKEDALQLLSDLLREVNSMSRLEKKHILLQNLLETYRLIEKNINLKLALENCFFDILKRQKK